MTFLTWLLENLQSHTVCAAFLLESTALECFQGANAPEHLHKILHLFFLSRLCPHLLCPQLLLKTSSRILFSRFFFFLSFSLASTAPVEENHSQRSTVTQPSSPGAGGSDQKCSTLGVFIFTFLNSEGTKPHSVGPSFSSRIPLFPVPGCLCHDFSRLSQGGRLLHEGHREDPGAGRGSVRTPVQKEVSPGAAGTAGCCSVSHYLFRENVPGLSALLNPFIVVPYPRAHACSYS